MNNQLALTVTAQIPGLCHVYILATRKGCMSGRSVCAQLSPWLFNVTRPFAQMRASPECEDFQAGRQAMKPWNRSLSTGS